MRSYKAENITITPGRRMCIMKKWKIFYVGTVQSGCNSRMRENYRSR